MPEANPTKHSWSLSIDQHLILIEIDFAYLLEWLDDRKLSEFYFNYIII